MTISEENLQLRGARVEFPTFRIEADFGVRPGERMILSGPSGSGKTTLFRLLAGFELGGSSSGRVLLGARDLSSLPAEKREFGVLFQEAVVFPGLSVIENAAYGLKIRGVGAEERRQRVLPWLERSGLARVAENPAALLSGGEKQRLSLVRAWCWKPRALLLDEPFSALDPALREEMGRWLIELHREHPVPLILITHDRDEASRVGTRVLASEAENGVRRWMERANFAG